MVTGSDDMQVRLVILLMNTLINVLMVQVRVFNVCHQVFKGHTHYVMKVKVNPKDNNTFTSASLDRTVNVWQLVSAQPNFTREGQEKGVNCMDYYMGGDKTGVQNSSHEEGLRHGRQEAAHHAQGAEDQSGTLPGEASLQKAGLCSYLRYYHGI